MNPDFKDILSEFTAAKVRFLVVGAYALAAHGLPRATIDIDIWVLPNSENAGKVWNALKSFGAPLTEVTRDDFARPGVIFQIGLPPNRIDILTEIDAVEFQEAWDGRIETDFDGLMVAVLGRTELLTNKRASGRPKDLIDVQVLEGGKF